MLPKKLDSSVFAEKYLTSDHSAEQIAQKIGTSKQLVLARIRQEGIRKTKGRGRSPENYRFPKSAPFGKRVIDGKLVVNPAEIKIARLIIELRDRKASSWAQVSLELNERGYRTRLKTPWQEPSIRRIYRLWSSKL